MNVSTKTLSSLALCALAFFAAPLVHAATTPSLGIAASFSVLGHTYTNNSTFTSLAGDLGYVVAPATAPVISGITHVFDATFTQAVSDQNTALAALNSQPCTFTFPAGLIDLATDTTHGPVGTYTPGIYCASGSMTIGGGATITLDGAGTFIFRPSGTLTTSEHSIVTGANGVSACDIFWTPGGSTTLGRSSTFAGTVIETVGPISLDITVNEGTNWAGRALDGQVGTWATVTTGIDVNISLPLCSAPPSPATLHVIKTVVNNNGGTAIASQAMVHVSTGMGNVSGSPQAGAASPGTAYTLATGTYTVSEDPFPGYTAIFSGDCDATGNVTLGSGDNKTCTVTNDDLSIPPPHYAFLHVIKVVVNNNGGTASVSSFNLHAKLAGADITGSPTAGAPAPGTRYTPIFTSAPFIRTYMISEDAVSGYTATFSGDCDATGAVVLMSGDDKTCTVTNDDVPPPPTPGPATLHVIKHVINNNGGTASASSFSLHVKGGGSFGPTDVSGSPAAGNEIPGTPYALVAGDYVVSEDPNTSYTQSFSGDCGASGHIALLSGDNKTCTITNDDIGGTIITTTTTTTGGGTEDIPPATLHVVKIVINDNGGKAIVSDAIIHVTTGSGDVTGSPHAGASAPGTSYALIPGTYNVSENFFPGYTVLVGGNCTASGNVTLASGDNKTCTITNNDIAGVVVPPPPSIITTPPSVKPPCDICQKLAYDVYIINPDGTERHTGTPWVKVTDRGNGVKRYSFEDATIDPHNPLFDYNDAVIDVDFKDCKSIVFMFVSSDASWKHQIKIKISIDGVTQSDTLVANDSKAVVGTLKMINATTNVNTKVACAVGSNASTGLKGKILLQVQQHGEAWYVHPDSGLRYYLKDGPAAYGLMRNLGLGITNQNLAAIPSVMTVDELKHSPSICGSNSSANKMKGKILLQVQQHGEAWYVDVTTCHRIYLRDGAAAYSVMRFLGLGIVDANLAKLKIGQ